MRFSSLLLAGVIAAAPALSASAESPGFAGGWNCDSICTEHDVLIFDVHASIRTKGDEAECRNKAGATSRGRIVSERTIRCFDSEGALSEDGETIRWTNGILWRRVHTRNF
ncbi:hypothetical+protein [Methylocapsa aurea]